MRIEEGVRGYLEYAHDGALMISGAWGSGKSYYIKNNLLEFIKTVDCSLDDLNANPIERVKIVLECFGGNESNKYKPVIVSVFGAGSIKELEEAISRAWMDSCSRGISKKVNKLAEYVGNIFEKSKKLKEYLDVCSILRAVPPLTAIPRDTVIILDDMERFDNLKISEVEMLGFVNNLCENLGFRVIIVANEEFLTNDKSPHLTFKEKVVGKTLFFTPHITEVARNIIASYKDERFSAFMSGEVMANSINPDAPLLRTEEKFVEQLGNLRTLKYAISHFHSLFRKMETERESLQISEQLANEILTYSWFLIIGLSIELKANHLSCLDVRGLDEFVYMAQGNIDFEGLGGDESDKPEAASKVENDKYPVPQGDAYAPWFFQFYIRKLAPQFLPVAVKQLINFVVKGDEIDLSELVNEYQEGKEALTPKLTVGDKVISQMMGGWGRLTNQEIETNLRSQIIYLEKGDFSNLTSFVNSSVFLMGLGSAVDIQKDAVKDAVERGVRRWLDVHELNDFEKTRFDAMGLSIQGEEIKEIYDNIKRQISEKEYRQNEQLVMELIAKFDTDLTGFCKEICPQAFEYRQSWGVTYPMEHPVLLKITYEQISQKMNNLQPMDVAALQGVLQNRYSTTNRTQIKQEELPFWKHLYETYVSMDPRDLRPAHLLFGSNVAPDLRKFIGS